MLRWHIERGDIVFPKSSTPQRIRENIDIFDFELSDDQIDELTGLDRVRRDARARSGHLRLDPQQV